MVEAVAAVLSLHVLEETRKEKQPLVLCKTCSVLSGQACVLYVDRGNPSFVVAKLKRKAGR